MQWGRVVARVGIVAGVAVALAACGGDEESPATATPASTARPSVTTTRTSTPVVTSATATPALAPTIEATQAPPESTPAPAVQPTQAPIVQPEATLPPPPPPPVLTAAPPPPPVVTEVPPPAPPVQAAVSLGGLAFSPASVSVTVGSTVVWTNNDSFPHDVKADGGEFASATMNNGDSYSAQFGSAGTFSYFCSIHPFMRGSVAVN